MSFLSHLAAESWTLLKEASPYMLFGIFAGGLLKVFLSPAYIARHLGKGRFVSVFKAALLGIPVPLCSCGVLPAAAALKKQGANNGATTAFLISTPESGVDSISITYALMDPVMTIARPLSAFLTAFVAGISENLINPPGNSLLTPDLSCPVDNCCSGEECDPRVHSGHHSFLEKILAGLRYAFTELWGDLANWFLFGLLLAALISVLIPEDLVTGYLGGGIVSMLLMLGIGIPLYICATASTPIAAAMIMKGVSPGAALVFLLVGPATNMASLSVLTSLLGRRATSLYLLSISGMSILCGLALDLFYLRSGFSIQAIQGQGGELFSEGMKTAAALLILSLSVKPLWRSITALTKKWSGRKTHRSKNCGCGSHGCNSEKLTSFPE